MSDIAIPQEIWDHEVATIHQPSADWLWHGFVARKGEKQIGQAARGSGALLGHVDISIEMRHPGGDPFTRRRRFLTHSRYNETPRQLLLELNADATDYLALPSSQEDESSPCWPYLRMVLEDADDKLTRQDILDEWPPDFDKPERSTLWRCLERGVARRAIACEGTGRKNDAFRYWLPEREAIWKLDPLYDFKEEQRRLMRAGPFDPDDFERQMRAFKASRPPVAPSDEE